MSQQSVERDLVVGVEYTLYDTQGEVVDASSRGEPVEFLQGHGQIISGLEAALYGMEVGEEKEVTLEPGEAYGERQEGAIQRVPRTIFPPNRALQEGQAVRLRDEAGRELTAYVAEAGDEEVVLDMNHPLAGETLRFELKVVSLRQPTAEELEHGHAHGGGRHEGGPMSPPLPQELVGLLAAVATALLGAALAWLGLLLLDRVARRTLDRDLLPLNRSLLQRLRPLVLALAFLGAAELSLERLVPLAAGSLAGDAANETLYLGRVLVLYLAVVRTLRHLADWYQVRIAPRTESTLDEQVLPFLRRVLLVLVTIAFLVSLLQHYGQDVGVVLASLGVASLAVALAARSTLEDVIAGIILMVDRPFRIGDRVELVGIDLVGDVADIGLRSTRIRTRDNRLIVVPNARIANDLLVNLSFPDPTLRLEFDVGVHYDSSIEEVRQVMLAAMSDCEGVRGEPEPQALFLGFGDSALHMRGRYWISSYADWRRMQDRVHTAVLGAFRQAGIEIPYTMTTLTLGREERRLLQRSFPSPSPEGRAAPGSSDDSRE